MWHEGDVWYDGGGQTSSAYSATNPKRRTQWQETAKAIGADLPEAAAPWAAAAFGRDKPIHGIKWFGSKFEPLLHLDLL